MPPASGTWRRTSVSRLSAACEHGGHPRPLGIQRGPQRVRRHVLGQRLAEAGRDLVAGAGAPLHLARVGQEQHRPDDVVGQRLRVAVGVVGDRARDAVRSGRVGDERDRVDVGAERRAGQRQPSGRRLERLAHALAPAQRVAGVVDLVEDHQRLEPLGADPQRERVDADAGVRDGHADVVAADLALARGVRRIDREPGLGRGLGPLQLEVLGRRDDDQPVDLTPPQQLGGDGERERRLAGARRRHGEEVPRGPLEVVTPARPTATRGARAPYPRPLVPARPERGQ